MKQKLFFIFLALAWAIIFTQCKKDDSVDLAGINVSKTSVTLKPSMADSLLVTFFPENTSHKTVTWASSNPAVATVSNVGKITAVGTGTTKIKVMSVNDTTIKASCDVTVAWTTLNNVTGYISGTWEKNAWE